MRLRGLGPRLAPAACGAVFFAGALLTARLAAADALARQDTAVSLQRAAALDRLVPPVPYLERLADLDPADQQAWRNAVLSANPRATEVRVARGLAAEEAKDLGGAEADLRQAARLDRRYLSAWTLANFYFRQGRVPEFWIWAHRAASLAYDDLRPLLALANAIEPDAPSALDRLGGGERLLRADLDSLVQRGDLDRAQRVGRLMIQRGAGGRPDPADAPRLLALADRQVRAGNASQALELWNATEPPLDPRHGAVLANADFAAAPTGTAFDWSVPAVAGVRSALQSGGLTFFLSGDQPETCVLLEQTIALAPGRRYRLDFEYLTGGLASTTGIAWQLGKTVFPFLAPVAGWTAGHAGFAPLLPSSPSSDLRLVPLRLLYRREPGTVRVPGDFALRHLRIQVLAGTDSRSTHEPVRAR